MFKKVHIKFGLAVLLLLTMILSFTLLTQAAESQTNTITVFYDENCKEVRLFYKSGDTEGETLQSGVAKAIPAGTANVRLELKLHDGYDIDESFDNLYVPIFKPDDLIYDFGVALTEDKSIVVTTKEKVYNINYIRTTPEGTADIGAVPTTHTYKTLTEIANPTLVGYNFEKWLILPTHPDNIPNFDPSNYTDVLLPSNAGKVELPATKLPSDPNQKTFYLYPVWSPYTYEVKAVDVIYSGDPDEPFGGYLRSEPYLIGLFPVRTEVKGNDPAVVANGVNFFYNGFYFDEISTLAIDKGTITVMANNENNIVYRYYSAYDFDLEYGCSVGSENLTLPEGSAELPTKHTYNKPTVLSEPILQGYTFAGWKVEVYQNGEWVNVSDFMSYTYPQITRVPNMLSAYSPGEPSAFYSEPCADYEGRRVIRLTATWKAKSFGVNFDFGSYVDPNFPTTTYNKYVYDTDLVIPNPVRPGYTFLGWTLTSGSVADLQIDAVDGYTTIPAKSYTNEILLAARWEANTYEITFDGNGADEETVMPPMTVVYDEAFALPQDFVFPTRIGHEFKGFSLDAEGLQMLFDASGTPLIPIWNIDGDSVLYAQWTLCSYEFSITDPSQTLFENAIVRVNGSVYKGGTLIFKYGEAVTVEVSILTTELNVYRPLKLILWKGAEDTEPQPIAHSYVYTYTFNMGAHNTELTGVVAPLAPIPQFKIDYLTETLVTDTGKLPNGKYRVFYGNESLLVEVLDGTVYITKNGEKEQCKAVTLGESAFDSTMISIVVCGNGVSTADSNVIHLPIEPRPSAPVLDAGGKGEIQYIYPHDDTKIIIQLTRPEDSALYEFACSLSNLESDIIRWYLVGDTASEAGTMMFENLKPGTPYYIFVRKRAAADEHPHGISQIIAVNTTSNSTIEAKKQELDELRKTAEGDVLRELIDQVKADLDALGMLGASPDFESRMNAILEQVSPTKITFARNKDLLIKNLTAYYNALINSGCFNDVGQNNLKNIYTYSVAAIKSAPTSESAQGNYDTGVLQMSEIRVTHMIHDVLHLISLGNNLPQGLTFRQFRMGDIENLMDSVYVSIENQKVVVNGNFMTAQEAQALLETLEVLASYSVELFYTQGNVAFKSFDPAGYEIHLLIPSNMLDRTGLQVAYFDEAKGEIKLLETKRVGNELVFYADSVEDFIILGDATVDMTFFLIAMSAILAMQLIAIAILLTRRKKTAEGTRMNSIAFVPTLLAAHFAPSGAMVWFLILCGLVIIAQIYLIYLLKTSVFHREGQDPFEEEDKTEKPIKKTATSSERKAAGTEQPQNTRKPTPNTAEDAAAAMMVFDDEPYDYEENQNNQQRVTKEWFYEDEDDQTVNAQSQVEKQDNWTYDPETGEVFEYVEDDENAYEIPVEDASANEKKKTETVVEEVVEEEIVDEIYIEPDITGDQAPPPGYYEET